MLNSMGQRLLTPKDAWQRANHRPQSIPQQMVQRNNSTGNFEDHYRYVYWTAINQVVGEVLRV